ncbi:MAG TPA: LysR family transcriptional regulator [Phenylobacterium sp.]|nr:LysR family transcriptional regulator [Phenylobacterium sp.]
MDIRHFQQILAIRDHGSFAKAAAALHMAQPALSKSMAKLEAELSLTIFTRTSTGSELTPMGEMIAQRAERVMVATQNLARDAALIAGGDTGAIRLGIGTLLKDTLLPAMLLKIVEEHPRLRLEIEFGAPSRLLPLVRSRELDLVLCGATPPDTLAYVEALRAEVIFVGAPTHPLASETQISIDRLAEFPCAGPNTPGFTAASILGRPSASQTLDAYTANDFEALMPLVYAGHAALMAPSFFVQRALRAGELVRFDMDWRGTTSFGCYTTHAASYSPILAEITCYAVELGEAVQQSWRE